MEDTHILFRICVLNIQSTGFVLVEFSHPGSTVRLSIFISINKSGTERLGLLSLISKDLGANEFSYGLSIYALELRRPRLKVTMRHKPDKLRD
jgi:hypothetical protein